MTTLNIVMRRTLGEFIEDKSSMEIGRQKRKYLARAGESVVNLAGTAYAFFEDDSSVDCSRLVTGYCRGANQIGQTAIRATETMTGEPIGKVAKILFFTAAAYASLM